MSDDGIFVCKTPFWMGRQLVKRGMTVRLGHPLLTGNEHLFKPFVVDFDHEPEPSKHSAQKPAPKSSSVKFEDPPEE